MSGLGDCNYRSLDLTGLLLAAPPSFAQHITISLQCTGIMLLNTRSMDQDDCVVDWSAPKLTTAAMGLRHIHCLPCPTRFRF